MSLFSKLSRLPRPGVWGEPSNLQARSFGMESTSPPRVLATLFGTAVMSLLMATFANASCGDYVVVRKPHEKTINLAEMVGSNEGIFQAPPMHPPCRHGECGEAPAAPAPAVPTRAEVLPRQWLDVLGSPVGLQELESALLTAGAHDAVLPGFPRRLLRPPRPIC